MRDDEEEVNDEEEFNKIFSRSTGRVKKNKNRTTIDDIPEDLLAEGSAKIGQKQ